MLVYLPLLGLTPVFKVALERTVTELLQGRGLEQLDGFQSPSPDLDKVADPRNLETHFIDSSGLISYRFFAQNAHYEFVDWNVGSNTETEFDTLSDIISQQGFEIYVTCRYRILIINKSCCRAIQNCRL